MLIEYVPTLILGTTKLVDHYSRLLSNRIAEFIDGVRMVIL